MKHYIPISEEEEKLLNLVRESNSYEEIQELLSLKKFSHLQEKLWWIHKDSTVFVEMWIESLGDVKSNVNKEHVLEILFRPKYDDRKIIQMQCIDVVDFSHRTVTKEFIEIKQGERYVPIADVKTKARETKNRVSFAIDMLLPNVSLYLPQCNHSRPGVYIYQPFLLNESSVEVLKNTSHFAITDVEILFQSSGKYYSSDARTKAVELCEDKGLLEKLLVDTDMRVKDAALRRLKAHENFSKEDIYKMLESNDANVRLQGIKLLKELDQN